MKQCVLEGLHDRDVFVIVLWHLVGRTKLYPVNARILVDRRSTPVILKLSGSFILAQWQHFSEPQGQSFLCGNTPHDAFL
jgi:hypothetical protein